MKKCYKCKAEKPLDSFAKRVASEDGKQLWCKECMNRRNAELALQRTLNGPTIIRDSKMCNKCDTRKPISQFYIKRTSPDGRGSYCKPCWTKIVAINVAKSGGK
jgi:hypothetical protein